MKCASVQGQFYSNRPVDARLVRKFQFQWFLPAEAKWKLKQKHPKYL